MSLFVVHDLERRPRKAAVRLAVHHEDDQIISQLGDAGDATALTVLTWRQPWAPRAATLAYGERTFMVDDSSAAAGVDQSVTFQIVRYRTPKTPRAALLGYQFVPPDTGDAPPPADLPGDATAMSVVVWRAWQSLNRWRGLTENTAQDDDGPTFNYASMSDFFVQYDPRLYSPMSRWLYQTAPAHDETAPVVSALGDATTLTVIAWHPQRLRRHDALHYQAVFDGDEDLPPVVSSIPSYWHIRARRRLAADD